MIDSRATLPEIYQHRKLIEAALEYTNGIVTFWDVRRGVLEGRLQLWPGDKSVAVTEIIGSDPYALHIFLVAGDMAEIEAGYPIVEKWAKEHHFCTSATCTARPGWEKTFLTKAAGWKPTLRVFEKIL